MGPLNLKIQSTSVELLHAIVARGEIDPLSLEVLEPVVIGKLYFTVHLRQLDLQNKLLRILHSLISVSSTYITHLNALRTEAHDGSESPSRIYTMNPLLTQTLVDGISLPHNRVMLQHWLDFVLMTIPQFQPALQGLISPIADCLARLLRSFLADVLRASKPDSTVLGIATDAEFVMLLNALERLLVLGLANFTELNQQDEDSSPQEKSGGEGGGILGYVSNVFTVDSPSTQTDEHQVVSLFQPILFATESTQARSPGYRSLHEGIRVLFAIWANFLWTDSNPTRPEDEMLSMIYNRSRARCRRVLEHLFRAHPNEVLESLIICWERDLTLHSGDSLKTENASFELVDILIASAHSAVHMICESVAVRTSGGQGGSRKYVNGNLYVV